MDANDEGSGLLELTVSELLGRWPQAAAAFCRLGLGDCVGCALDSFDTLQAAISTHGLDQASVLRELTSVLGASR